MILFSINTLKGLAFLALIVYIEFLRKSTARAMGVSKTVSK